jgi:hypothetical protein
MTRFRNAMLLATIATGVIATAASAQTTIAARPGQTATTGNDTAGTEFSLLGTGASSIQTVLVQELNCIGGANQLGRQDGTLTTVAEPAALPTPAGAFDCAAQSLQPNFSGKYVATGSGFGRQAWRTFTNQFANKPAGTAPFTGGVFNPFTPNENPWPHVQFAFADSSATVSDLTAYSAGQADDVAGPAVQFPKFVLPVAVAYNPVYGINAAGEQMRFNVRSPLSINGVVAGGMRVSRDLYCRMFNGQVINFNNTRFTSGNGGTPLFDPTNDTAARWSADGVPVRLVGRLDRSGTTDIFTRALAAQCNDISGLTNKFKQNAETLPYNRGTAGAADFTSARPDTGLRPGSSDPTAGSDNSVGNQYFTGSAIASVPGGVPAGPTGNRGSGLFLVADGSSRVRDAINFAPDYALNGVTLNGKIGYIGADFIVNSPTGSATLYAAALQQAKTTTYLMPSAANGLSAFAGIIPPESNGAGQYVQGDTRVVRLPNGTNGAAKRENPLAWYDVMYNGTTTLANPVAGYPMTGTTQFLGYTCYTPQNREHIVNFLGWNTDATTRDAANADRTGIFTSTTSGSQGLLAQSNIGAMPTPWRSAVFRTFLVDSATVSNGQRLGDLDLWLQSTAFPGGNLTRNANCTGKAGA